MGEESARSAGSEATAAGATAAGATAAGGGGATAAGARGRSPRKILTGLYAKPIGYQYRRFKTVD